MAPSGAGQPQQAPRPPYGAPGQPFAPDYSGGTAGGSGRGGRKGLLIGLVAGGVALILLVCGVGGFFIVTAGGGPGDVVEDYIQAQIDEDFEAECELRSADYRENLLDEDGDDCGDYADRSADDLEDTKKDFEDEYGQSYDDAFDDIEFDVEITDVNEKGDDEAIVEYEGSYEYQGDNDQFLDDYFGGDETDSFTGWYRVVKEDGDWRVDEDCSDEECAS
ncbi:hypothetical protein [Nocardioides sp. YIM 152588]|uniref:hypothetical protein n=1 Tax=Nocardioides sp. YIM 152588 TaxID=3158259 RepID=UPI0032E42A12